MPNFFAVLDPDLTDLDDGLQSDRESDAGSIAEQDVTLDSAAERRALLAGPDLLPSLIKLFDQPTLATAMRVHTSFNKLAGALLYGTVVFDYSKPFNRSIGARILHQNYRPEYREGAESFEYGKARHFAKHTTTLEIINFRGGTPDGWHCRVARLRELCPRLDVIRFHVHPAGLLAAYHCTMHDASHAGWHPRVVDFIPADLQNKQPASFILAPPCLLNLEAHLRFDTTQPMEIADQIYDQFSLVFGLPQRWSPERYDTDAAVQIDIVGGFESGDIVVPHINHLTALFLDIRTNIRVVIYAEKQTRTLRVHVKTAQKCLKMMVKEQRCYREEHHRERLDACSFEIRPMSEMYRYAALDPHAKERLTIASGSEDDDEDDDYDGSDDEDDDEDPVINK